MPEYLSPGVYVEEINLGVRPIEGVGTSTKRNYARLVFSLKSNAIILPQLDHRHRSQGGTVHGQGWRIVRSVDQPG